MTPDDSNIPDTPESDEMTAALGLPAKVNPGDSFNAVISIDQWDNEAGYKLIDLIMNVPGSVSVTGVTPGSGLKGGEVSYHLENGKLRIVYFDANNNADLTMSDETFPATLMTIGFTVSSGVTDDELEFSVSGMSLKKSADSADKDAMVDADTSAQPSEGTDNYLSDVTLSDDRVYSDNTESKPAAAPSSPGQETDSYLSAVTGGSSQVYSDGSTVNVQTSAPSEESAQTNNQNDNYLSGVKDSDDKVYTGKDKYNTDPVPAGKPKPVEPEDQEVDKGQTYTCTFSIECSTILNNLDQLDPDKLEMVPSGGVILKKTTVTFYEGESVYDVLQRVCKDSGIHMEASWTPIYNSAYVEGIHNLYEFDCGALSGWMYKVNGWYPNYGSSRYQLKDGDSVEWRYTCDLGNDIGGGYAVGG